jgi:type II secretory pathway component PulC
LRITGLDQIPLAEAFGLKNGDIVQAVNGQQLTSKQKAFQILQKAKTQSKVNIRILRDGKSKDLSFNL